MKKILFGIVALTTVSFAGSGELDVNNGYKADKKLTFNSAGENTTENFGTATSSSLLTKANFYTLLGEKNEFLVYGGGIVDNKLINVSNNLNGYAGIRYSGNVHENIKLTVSGAALFSNVEKSNDNSMDFIKKALKSQTGTDNEDDLLKQHAFRLSKDKDPILLSLMLEGKWGSQYFRLGTTYNSYYFEKDTSRLDTRLNFGVNLGLLRVDGNIVNEMGNPKGQEVDKLWFSLGGRTSGSVTLKLENIAPNLTLKSKPSFKLDKTLAARSEEDIKAFIGNDFNFKDTGNYKNLANLEKVESHRRYDLGIENDVEYKIGEVTLGAGVDFRTSVLDIKLKDLNEGKVMKSGYSLKMKNNMGEITLKPAGRLSLKYEGSNTTLSLGVYDKYVSKRYMGEVNRVNNSGDKTPIPQNIITDNNIFAVNAEMTNNITEEFKLRTIAKYRLNHYLKNSTVKPNEEKKTTHILYTGLGLEYNKEMKNLKVSSNTQARALNLFLVLGDETNKTYPKPHEATPITNLFIRSETTITNEIRRDLTIEAGLKMYGRLRAFSDTALNKKNSNLFSLVPSLKLTYVKGRFTVTTEFNSTVSRKGEVSYNGDSSATESKIWIGTAESLSTNVDYVATQNMIVGLGLGLEYAYNGLKSDDTKDYMDALNKLDSKLGIDDEAFQKTNANIENALLKEVKLPSTISINGAKRHTFKVKPNLHAKLNFLDNRLNIGFNVEAQLQHQTNLDGVKNKEQFSLNNIGVKTDLSVKFSW